MPFTKNLSNLRFSVGLRTHIFIMQASVMVVLVYFLYAFWTPSLLEREKHQYLSSIRSHLSTVADALIPLILDHKVASIYETLDSLLSSNPDWEMIEYFDGKGRAVYPFDASENEFGNHDIRLGEDKKMFTQKIILADENLGTLYLNVDFRNHLERTYAAYQQLGIVFLVLLFGVGIFSALIGEFTIRRPIRGLVLAAEKMSNNDFAVELPTSKVSELSRLIRRFSSMRERLSRYQEDLEHKVAEQTVDIRRNAAFTQVILETMLSALVVHDGHRIVKSNRSAESLFDLTGNQLRKTEICEALQAMGLSQKQTADICSGTSYKNQHFSYQAPNGEEFHLSVSQIPLLQTDDHEKQRFLIVAEDVTNQVKSRLEKERLESDLLQAQKLEAVGQLAGGIAHEINTPSQYIGDNLQFLSESQGDVLKVVERLLVFLEKCKDQEALAPDVSEIQELIDECDLAYLLDEIPNATNQSISGIAEVSRIVLAMKDFSHPGTKEMSSCDINRALSTTLTVSRGEWKSVAELREDLDPELPGIDCFLGELNQVFLNLVVNAAHAIQEKGGSEPGKITVSTSHDEDNIMVRIGDNGNGIPDHISDQIFNPFFTTKEVGKGTGQGLAIARDIIVNKHGGDLSFESAEGVGTTFIISLPRRQPDVDSTDQKACA